MVIRLQRLLRTAIAHLAHQVGYDCLGTVFQRYLWVCGAFTVATLLSKSFFNVFLLRATGSSAALMRYNLLLACIQPFVMLLAVQVLKRGSMKLCLRVGLALLAGAYLCLAIIPETTEKTAYVISCVFSAGNAFYYTCYTPMLLSYTSNDNRDTAYGAMGAISTFGSLTLPILTGFFISAFGDLVGYKVLFFISFIVLALAFACSFRLHPIVQRKEERSVSLWKIAKQMIKNRNVRTMMIVTGLSAAEVGGRAYYGSLLVYKLLEKESIIGIVTTLGAVLTLLANLSYGRIVRSDNRGKSMVIGAACSLVSVIILCFFQTAWGYILYYLLFSLMSFFVTTPVVTEYMSVLQEDELLRNHGGEVHTLREFSNAAGCTLGLLPAFLFHDAISTAAPMMIVVSCLQLLGSVLLTYMSQKRIRE